MKRYSLLFPKIENGDLRDEMPSILESFGLDSREYQLGKQKVERGLKCFTVTWSDGVSNLEQTCTKKKAHHQNLILQGTLRLLTTPIFP